MMTPKRSIGIFCFFGWGLRKGCYCVVVAQSSRRPPLRVIHLEMCSAIPMVNISHCKCVRDSRCLYIITILPHWHPFSGIHVYLTKDAGDTRMVPGWLNLTLQP